VSDGAASPAPRTADARVQRIVEVFEALAAQGLMAQLGAIYAQDAWFKDPFNEVRGVAAIEAIFAHMFRTLEGPRFVVRDIVVQERQCFLTWDFLFRPRRAGAAPMCVRGASHLVLDEAGRIARHRDYWDVAEELYEKLPLLGTLMRWLKRRASS
jgi:ketosteroid isomerase-like protein